MNGLWFKKLPIISQGSVATCLMCGGIFNDSFTLLSLVWKNLEIRSAFSEVTGRSIVTSFFDSQQTVVRVFWATLYVSIIITGFFTARHYASAVYAVVVCPSVCLSVRLSVTRRYCTKTAKRKITQIAPDSNFLTPKMSAKFQRGYPNGWCQIEVG